MISRPVVVSPVKAILAIRLFWRERLAGFDAEAVDDVDDAGRQDVGDQFHDDQDAKRCLLGRLQHHAIAGGKRRRELPGRHQDREIPRNDLADDAERFVEMIGDRVLVDLRDAAFLGAHDAGEIAQMVDDQRHVGMRRLADRLAVVERLDQRQQIEIAFHLVGDPVQDARALLDRGLAPGVLGLMRGIERELDVGRRGAGDLTEPLAGDRARIVEILAFDRRDPFSADEIVVAVADQNLLRDLV